MLDVRSFDLIFLFFGLKVQKGTINYEDYTTFNLQSHWSKVCWLPTPKRCKREYFCLRKVSPKRQ